MLESQLSERTTRGSKGGLKRASIELDNVAAASRFIWEGLWNRDAEHVALDMCDVVILGPEGSIDKWLFTSHDKVIRKRRLRSSTWERLVSELIGCKDESAPPEAKVAVGCINGVCKDLLKEEVSELHCLAGLEFLVFSKSNSRSSNRPGRFFRHTYELRRNKHQRSYAFMQTHVIVDQGLRLGTGIASSAMSPSVSSHASGTLPSLSNEINGEADRLVLRMVEAIEARKDVRMRKLVVVLLVAASEQGAIRVQYHHAMQVVYNTRLKQQTSIIKCAISMNEVDTLTVSSSLRTSFNAIGRCVGDFCAYNEEDELLRMGNDDEVSSGWKAELHTDLEVLQQRRNVVPDKHFTPFPASGDSVLDSRLSTESVGAFGAVTTEMSAEIMNSRTARRATRRLAHKSIIQARVEWELRFNSADSRHLNESDLPAWPAVLIHWCKRQLRHNGVVAATRYGLGVRADALGLYQPSNSGEGHRRERFSAPARIKPAAAALYYDDVGVCRACYKVYTDLDKRRKIARKQPIPPQEEQEPDPWKQLEQQMHREARMEREKEFIRRLHESKTSQRTGEVEEGRLNSHSKVRQTSTKILPPVPWALQGGKEAAAYAAQGSSFVRNMEQKTRTLVDAAKRAMDVTTDPDLSHLFQKPKQLATKPTLAPQRRLPPSALLQESANSGMRHKFQHERLMHPWQREFERIKKEEAAAESGEVPRKVEPNGAKTMRQPAAGMRDVSNTENDDNDHSNDNENDNEEDEEEGIGWSPFLVPVDVP